MEEGGYSFTTSSAPALKGFNPTHPV